MNCNFSWVAHTSCCSRCVPPPDIQDRSGAALRPGIWAAHTWPNEAV